MVQIEGTPIVIDEFPLKKHAYVFILTHLHADHTVGLSPSWHHGPIYCTPVTSLLLSRKFQIDESLVNPVPLNTPTLIPLDPRGQNYVTVTFLGANHCPGAAMVVLQGYFGNVIHTGDFRYTPEMLTEFPMLKEITFDQMFLDNTYCHPRFRFPVREDVARQILELILENNDKKIVLGIDTLGKEELLVYLASELKTKAVISAARAETLRALDMEDVFVSEEFPDAFLFVVLKNELSAANLAKWNEERPTIGIMPSMMPFATNPLMTSSGNKDQNLFFFPYSLHSSFPELRQFVQAVKTRQIIPIVPDKDVAPFEHFRQFLVKEPPAPFLIPLEVQDAMGRLREIREVSDAIGFSQSQTSQMLKNPKPFKKFQKGFKPTLRKMGSKFASSDDSSLEPNLDDPSSSDEEPEDPEKGGQKEAELKEGRSQLSVEKEAEEEVEEEEEEEEEEEDIMSQLLREMDAEEAKQQPAKEPFLRKPPLHTYSRRSLTSSSPPDLASLLGKPVDPPQTEVGKKRSLPLSFLQSAPAPPPPKVSKVLSVPRLPQPSTPWTPLQFISSFSPPLISPPSHSSPGRVLPTSLANKAAKKRVEFKFPQVKDEEWVGMRCQWAMMCPMSSPLKIYSSASELIFHILADHPTKHSCHWRTCRDQFLEERDFVHHLLVHLQENNDEDAGLEELRS